MEFQRLNLRNVLRISEMKDGIRDCSKSLLHEIFKCLQSKQNKSESPTQARKRGYPCKGFGIRDNETSEATLYFSM